MTPETHDREIARMVIQLRCSYQGPAWHGPAVKQTLEGVTAEVASRKPAAGEHTIWELVNHIAFWAGVARRTFGGEAYPLALEPPADWPAPSGTWEEALAAAEQEQQALIRAVKGFPAGRLDELVTDKRGYTYYVLVHGVVGHNIYHAGQIAVLKK
jgi:uncharacterized damage-inducible protein DinB